MRGLFVTGTDTDVGKTRVAVALLQALARANVRAIGMKPVAAGFEAGHVQQVRDQALEPLGLADDRLYQLATRFSGQVGVVAE